MFKKISNQLKLKIRELENFDIKKYHELQEIKNKKIKHYKIDIEESNGDIETIKYLKKYKYSDVYMDNVKKEQETEQEIEIKNKKIEECKIDIEKANGDIQTIKYLKKYKYSDVYISYLIQERKFKLNIKNI